MRIEGVRRIGKMPRRRRSPTAATSRLTLLVHLMSAGRLQLFDKRASLKDRARGCWSGSTDGRELRLREFGTRQRPGRSCCAPGEVEADEMVATLGPGRVARAAARGPREALDQPRHLHPLLRDQRTIAGIGRSWVDEILWEAKLSPFKQGLGAAPDEDVGRLHDALRVLGDAIDHYEEVVGDSARQDADAAEGPPARGRAVPALRHDDRGGLLLRAPPTTARRADRRPGAEGRRCRGCSSSAGGFGTPGSGQVPGTLHRAEVTAGGSVRQRVERRHCVAVRLSFPPTGNHRSRRSGRESPHRGPGRTASDGFEQHPDVERRRRVGERADRDEVDARSRRPRRRSRA